MYTVVQHSGFGYAGNPQFEKGLEEREVTKKRDIEKIRNAGGMLFASYLLASVFAEEEMYRDDDSWNLIPKARGTFARAKIDGLRIYIPPKGAKNGEQ